MVELGSYPAIERAGWSISTYGRARLCPTRRAARLAAVPVGESPTGRGIQLLP